MNTPPQNPTRSLQLKVPPVALVLLAGLVMWALPPLAGTAFFQPYQPWLSGALFLLGAAVCLAGVLAFRIARTTVDPMHPSAASSLVQGGIYRLTRNPMYLGFLLMLVGWALHVATLSALIVLPAFAMYMTVFQIQPEERALRARFGPTFDAYMARVRRWI